MALSRNVVAQCDKQARVVGRLLTALATVGVQWRSISKSRVWDKVRGGSTLISPARPACLPRGLYILLMLIFFFNDPLGDHLQQNVGLYSEPIFTEFSALALVRHIGVDDQSGIHFPIAHGTWLW